MSVWWLHVSVVDGLTLGNLLLQFYHLQPYLLYLLQQQFKQGIFLSMVAGWQSCKWSLVLSIFVWRYTLMAVFHFDVLASIITAISLHCASIAILLATTPISFLSIFLFLLLPKTDGMPQALSGPAMLESIRAIALSRRSFSSSWCQRR